MVSIAARALLLDLDGTLVDSATVVESAWQWAAEQLGVPFRLLAPYMHGIPADQALELAIPGIEGPTKSRLADEILSRQVDSNAAVSAMPGALRLLDRLPAGSWAVVTSGSVRLAESSIHKAGLPEPPILITADDVQAGKPHPEPFMRAMGVLDVSPEECIVIEDSPLGIASGLAAGVRVLAVGTHDAQPAQPATCASRLSTLPASSSPSARMSTSIPVRIRKGVNSSLSWATTSSC